MPTLPDNLRDLTDHLFGDLRVVSFAGKRSGRCQWNCVCQCPLKTEMVVSHFALWNEVVHSCGKSRGRGGCCRKPRYGSDRGPSKKFVDLAGRKFGELTVLKHHGKYRNKHFWFCKCSCGCSVSVTGTAMVSGNTRSCGCIRRDGYTMVERKDRKIEATSLWMTLCRKYRRKMDPVWVGSFENFYRDVGDRPSKRHRLARLDVNEDWSAGNAVWTTIEGVVDKRIEV
jgi:hypothetical protein